MSDPNQVKKGDTVEGRSSEKLDSSKMAFYEYQNEIGNRNVYTMTPEVIQFETSEPIKMHNFPGGGIWVVLAEPGSKTLSQLREAASVKSYEKLASLIERGRKSLLKQTQEKVFDSIHDVPVMAELTYGTKTVAQGLFVLPETDGLFVFIPYNGGELSPNRFKLSQYFSIGSEARLDSLILIRRPTLTELEKSILQKVPSDVSEANIGLATNPGFAGMAWTFVAEVVATYVAHKLLDAATDVVACWIHGDKHEGRHRATYTHGTVKLRADQADNNGGSLGSFYGDTANAAELKELDVQSAAVELLNLRTQLIKKGMTF